jgi:hypothetical protein
MGGNNVWTGTNNFAAVPGGSFFVVPAVALTDAVTLTQTLDVLDTIVKIDAGAIITGKKILSGVTTVPHAGTDANMVNKEDVDNALLAIGAVELSADNVWTAQQNFGTLNMDSLTTNTVTVSALTATTVTGEVIANNTCNLGALSLTTGSISQLAPTGASNSFLIDEEWAGDSPSGYFFTTADNPYQMTSSICNPFVLTMSGNTSATVRLPLAPTCGQQLSIQSLKIGTVITVEFQGRLYYQKKNSSPVFYENTATFGTNVQLEMICWDNTQGAVAWLLYYAE